MERGGADDEGSGAGGQQHDGGLKNLRPGDRRLEHPEPAFQMVRHEPVLVVLEERDVLDDHVHEQIGQRQDGGRRRFHVETGKHERERQ